MLSSFSLLIREFEKISENTEVVVLPNLIGKISPNTKVHNKFNAWLKSEKQANLISELTAAVRIKSGFGTTNTSRIQKRIILCFMLSFNGKNGTNGIKNNHCSISIFKQNDDKTLECEYLYIIIFNILKLFNR